MEHEVWIPAIHRDLTGGEDKTQIGGETMGEVIANLDAKYPGIANRLTEEGRVRPNISVAVNGEMIHRGLFYRLKESSEIHFVPAVGGGMA